MMSLRTFKRAFGCTCHHPPLMAVQQINSYTREDLTRTKCVLSGAQAGTNVALVYQGYTVCRAVFAYWSRSMRQGFSIPNVALSLPMHCSLCCSIFTLVCSCNIAAEVYTLCATVGLP